MAFGRPTPERGVDDEPEQRERGESARAHRHHLQRRERVRIQRLAMPVQRNDDSETDGQLPPRLR